MLRPLLAAVLILLASCEGGAPPAEADTSNPLPIGEAAPADTETANATVAATASSVALDSATLARTPNEMGRIMILEYHLVGDKEARWERHHERFRQDLGLLYERGYRPVSVAELVDGRIDLPRGLSPVVFTFDDASPSQFRYVEQPDGSLAIDSTSAVGIWMNFAARHPDWRPRAVFCLLSGAEAGRSFFGNRGIEGQKSEWRFPKLRFLAEQGFELCNHTLWHANLGRYDDAFVQEQIARGVLAIDSAVTGYRVRTFALPLGVWPKQRELAIRGSWTDPRTRRETRYEFDAVLEVAGGPARSPFDPAFNPHSLPRVQVYGNELERTLDHLDRSGTRYVSAGPRAPGDRAARR
jgi:hypothetical protein